jgi:hypothetical protein
MGFPNLPGVPPLKINPTVAAAAGTLAAPLINNLLDKAKRGWGVFSMDNLKKDVISPDSYISIDYRNESNIPMFPIEKGAFDSYNKVSTPYTVTIKVAKGAKMGLLAGGTSDLKSFLDTINTIHDDTKLYAIVTPEATYLNANMKSYGYKRETNNGAAMIIAMLDFVEIMQTQTQITTSSATLTGPDPVGTVSSAQAFKQSGNVQGITIPSVPTPSLTPWAPQ